MSIYLKESKNMKMLVEWRTTIHVSSAVSGRVFRMIKWANRKAQFRVDAESINLRTQFFNFLSNKILASTPTSCRCDKK